MTSTKNKMAPSNEDTSEHLSQQVENLSIADDMLTTCANCGKEGSNLNICNKCKSVTYCNAVCKKRHRSKHKQDCERRVTQLLNEDLERKMRAVELHDEKLFKMPPPKGDCDICMLLLPSLLTGSKYRACCGKRICSGCSHALQLRDGGVGLCPFCRSPTPTSEELIKQYKKRIEAGDAEAMYGLGCSYSDGSDGLFQDHAKALELWHRAGELGYAISYYSIGCAYDDDGRGVERDEKKAIHYWELAAMGGHAMARHNLGVSELHAGNMDRALKHFMLVAGGGIKESLSAILEMFKHGHATKNDYAKALQAYQANLVEIKSPQRDEAAAFHERYGYY